MTIAQIILNSLSLVLFHIGEVCASRQKETHSANKALDLSFLLRAAWTANESFCLNQLSEDSMIEELGTSISNSGLTVKFFEF